MNVPEIQTYEEGIYQIELTDPVIGGADGIANLQAKQLANRTNWLKAALEKIVDGTTTIVKALKLATARKISLGGALSGSANFDGSADITIEASFANGVLTINSINGLSDALNGLSSTKQPLDATLTSLANLTTAANKFIYATGVDTFSVADLSVFARSMLDDIDAATMRNTLGALGSMSANDTNVKSALNANGSAPIYACRAWVNFNGAGTVAIRASGNVSSITDNGNGDYTINLTSALVDANSSVSALCQTITTNNSTLAFLKTQAVSAITANTVRITTGRASIPGVITESLQDMEYVCVSIFR